LTKTNTKQETIKLGREALSQMMFTQASKFTDAYGIELIDIIIRQIRYSDDLTESVYQRMIKERNQIAEAYRSYGRGQLAQWQGKTENEQKTILSTAYAESERIKGVADAQAAKIYADAYQVDPDFFRLWRTLESYRKTIPSLNKVLSTDMEYFDVLYGDKEKK
jgi:membrane protease subunit HflC